MSKNSVLERADRFMIDPEGLRTEKESWMVCRRCQHTIANSTMKFNVEGTHEHLQCNPDGFTFVFGCYKDAPGCQVVGQATNQFTWFNGFQWRLAICQECYHHLGWYFNAKGQNYGFFGLISNCVRETKS